MDDGASRLAALLSLSWDCGPVDEGKALEILPLDFTGWKFSRKLHDGTWEYGHYERVVGDENAWLEIIDKKTTKENP